MTGAFDKCIKTLDEAHEKLRKAHEDVREMNRYQRNTADMAIVLVALAPLFVMGAALLFLTRAF